MGLYGAYGAAPYQSNAVNPNGTPSNTVDLGQNGTAQLSNVTPYVENDKSSRLSAIFEGITGTITSLGDAYARINYKPQPIGVPSRTAPPLYAGAYPGSTTFDAQGNPVTTGPSLFANPLLWVIGVVLVVVFFMFRKR